MRIVVEGCAHGDLDKIYDVIQSIEQKQSRKVDLLICCGDFQSNRNLADLSCMAVPPKYLDMCSFYKYYSGEKLAPILTIFIGGNHEASNYLQELAYGGWVAPNIYYLGYAGVINVNGVRIGGISGIFRDHHFEKGHFEFPPYDEETARSAYAIRSIEVFRLSQLSGSMDVMLSHDWPQGIWDFGNKQQLLRFKPYFRDDMENGRMGSGPCWDLLTLLQPKHWYSAHMHCRFDANVQHSETGRTKFVALDKCLPNRKFLDFLDIGDDNQNPPEIKYDLEWLTVLHLTNNLLNVSPHQTKLPLQPGPDDPQDNKQRFEFVPTEEEMNTVLKKFNNDLTIPKNFTQTTVAYDPQRDGKNFRNLNPFVKVELNPQTTDFCVKLSLDDPLFLATKFKGIDLTTSTINLSQIISNEAVQIPVVIRAPLASFLPQPKFGNDEEIDLDELEGDEETEEKKIVDEKKIEEVQKPSEDVSVVPQTQQNTETEEDSLKVTVTQPEPPKVTEDTEFGSPPAKRFKRRNLEMYAATEDE